MKPFLELPLIKRLGVAATASLGIHGAVMFIQWYAVSSIGFGGVFFLQFIAFLALPLLVVFLAVPISILLLPFRRLRRHALTVVACGPVYAIVGFALLSVESGVRMDAFRRLAARSRPLIDAVHRFSQERGRPPETLEELVPDYLAKIPPTGMPAYPTYRYSTEASRWDGNPWVVYVDCTSGGVNFDKFMYFPMGNYPDRGYGGILERVEEWAYVHE